MKRLAVLIVAALSACAGGGGEPVPIWYVHKEVPGYEGDRYIIGVALDTWLKGRNIPNIETRAKADLAAQIESTVKSRVTSYTASNISDGEEKLVERFRSRASEESKLLLTNVKRIQVWTDPPSDRAAVAVMLDRKLAARQFADEIELIRRRVRSVAEAGKDFRELLLSGRVRRLAQERIDYKVLKGRLYCGKYFQVPATELAADPAVYDLDVSALQGPEKAWMPGLFNDIFRDYGVVFESGAARKLRVKVKVSEMKGVRWPTQVADVSITETVGGAERLVWNFEIRAAHSISLERARTLLRVRAGESILKKLKREIDEPAERLLGSRGR